MNLKNIGKNIKALRKEKGLTQEKLAEKLNISTVHISHIETGNVCMSLELLINICNILKITPNDVLLGEFNSPLNNSLNISNEKIIKLTSDEFVMLNKITDLFINLKINR